ncbi:MAG: crossover junction endodeoxyribonuclease RuvC [Proteobacteria bacterium]|jgi:crossover junction endodeoxyribonuclease RuvC|nr:crossover junction endodeoxyribonuclease RuvC [Pseudomonadota bacterium]
MTRILGIDPGSRFTGYGVIDMNQGRAVWVGSGCIRIKGEDLAERLRVLTQGLTEILDQHQPELIAVEQVFMHRNADSALKLGQARGAAISTVAIRHLPVHEYTPTQIKKAIVGKGNAAKSQVQHMIRVMLGLNAIPQEDAADALAVALCHAHTSHTLTRMSATQVGLHQLRRMRRGRLR